jgi:hypothetical protein
MIAELIKFASIYDPNYPKSVLGATESDLARLEHLFRPRLPAPYKEFLTQMGRSTGAIQIEDTTFTIDMVLRSYERRANLPPSPFLFIGASSSEPPASFYIDTREPDESSQTIVTADTGDEAVEEHHWPLFPSLEEMLYVHAFRSLRMSHLPYARRLGSYLTRKGGATADEPSTTVEEVEHVLLTLKFRRLPCTSPLNPLFEREHAAVLGHQNVLGGGLDLEIAADNASESTLLLEILRDNLPLR